MSDYIQIVNKPPQQVGFNVFESVLVFCFEQGNSSQTAAQKCIKHGTVVN